MKNSNYTLSAEDTKKLVSAFLEAERKYKVPAKLLSAFAFVESSYRLDSANNRTKDYGIMQVNKYNIKAYNIDKKRLVTDLQYSVNKGALILTWFLSKYKMEEAIKRYNCGVRKNCIKNKKVIRYGKKILAAL